MEARYLHYYVIYNANLDSNHPVKESILRQQLKQWEMVQHQPSFGDAEWKELKLNGKNSLQEHGVTKSHYSEPTMTVIFYHIIDISIVLIMFLYCYNRILSM